MTENEIKATKLMRAVAPSYDDEFDTLLGLFPHLHMFSRNRFHMCVEGENRKPVYVSVERHPYVSDSIICTGRLPGVPMKIYGHGEFEYAVDI